MRTIIFILLGFISSLGYVQVTGSFVDARDGKTYKTVQIGSQIWMAENLAYKTNDCLAPNGNNSLVSTYGYLYQFDSKKDVCPSGWHIPSDIEWKTLIKFLGGEKEAAIKLKEVGTTHWLKLDNATNSFGFKALPAGVFGTLGYESFGEFAEWWTSSAIEEKYDEYRIEIMPVSYGIQSDKLGLRFSKTIGSQDSRYSIRCIKD